MEECLKQKAIKIPFKDFACIQIERKEKKNVYAFNQLEVNQKLENSKMKESKNEEIIEISFNE